MQSQRSPGRKGSIWPTMLCSVRTSTYGWQTFPLSGSPQHRLLLRSSIRSPGSTLSFHGASFLGVQAHCRHSCLRARGKEETRDFQVWRPKITASSFSLFPVLVSVPFPLAYCFPFVAFFPPQLAQPHLPLSPLPTPWPPSPTPCCSLPPFVLGTENY